MIKRLENQQKTLYICILTVSCGSARLKEEASQTKNWTTPQCNTKFIKRGNARNSQQAKEVP